MDILLIIGCTIIFIGAYYFISYSKTGGFSIDTIFQLLVATPMVVLLFINIIKKRKNE